jgi:hypothetical protein
MDRPLKSGRAQHAIDMPVSLSSFSQDPVRQALSH